MKRYLLAFALPLIFTALTVPSHAATVDNFVFTYGADTYTFSLPSPLLGLPPYALYPPYPQFYVDIPVDKDGVTEVGHINFYGEGTRGGLQIEGVYAQGPYLFAPDPTATYPIFNLGTTNLTVYGLHLDPHPASITISETTSATPEPSTLALILTSGLPVGAYLRRRLSR